MSLISKLLGLSKEEPAPPPPLKPARCAVHLPSGMTVVHYACYRKVADGGLVLHNDADGNRVVAHYPPGQWASLTIGHRAVSVPIIKTTSKGNHGTETHA